MPQSDHTEVCECCEENSRTLYELKGIVKSLSSVVKTLHSFQQDLINPSSETFRNIYRNIYEMSTQVDVLSKNTYQKLDHIKDCVRGVCDIYDQKIAQIKNLSN